jgi:hypothetical protein
MTTTLASPVLHPTATFRSDDLAVAATTRRQRLEASGYLFLRGVIAPELAKSVGKALLAPAQAAGWIADATQAEHGAVSCSQVPSEGSPEHLTVYRHIIADPAFASLTRHPGLLALLAEIFATKDLLDHPRVIARLSSYGHRQTPPHQDHPLIKGTLDTLTAWIPLLDCPLALGGLALLPGSHRHGPREHTAMPGPGGVGIPSSIGEPGWATIDYRAGDILLFTSTTVHGALAHVFPGHLRLSVDLRFQRRADAIDPDSLRSHYGLLEQD